MITFPHEFIETKFAGYFWHTVEKQLYSIKVSGILTPLKMRKCYMVMGRLVNIDNYRVSVGGDRRTLFTEDLIKLELPTKHVIPIYKQESK